jgi:hypothetical protein
MTQDRIDPPYEAGERAMLDAWLDYHRVKLAMKCDGLSDAQLRERAVPPSTLSLLGLVRHMADVERNWFRRVLGGEEAPPLFLVRRRSGRRLRQRRHRRRRGGVRELALGVRAGQAGRGGGAVARGHRPAARRAGVAALDPRPHDRGVRPPQRARRPAPRAHRRHGRRLRRPVAGWLIRAVRA